MDVRRFDIHLSPDWNVLSEGNLSGGSKASECDKHGQSQMREGKTASGVH